LFFKSQTRGEARALTYALLVGAGLGLAVGGVYFTGAATAQALTQEPAVERLADAAKAGFSDEALEAEAAQMSPGALAAARRHDPYTAAGGPERDRQAALAAAAAIAGRQASATHGGAAEPFRVTGALDSSRDLDCLSAAVYYEARGETAAGQAAVAQVVLNRSRHPAYPKTICGVVYQGANAGGCQFSFVCDGSMRRGREPGAWARARAIAARALGGYVMADVGQAVSFHVARMGSPWGGGMIRVSQVGGHIFYRMNSRLGAARAGAYAVDVGRASETVARPIYAPADGVTADGEASLRVASATPAASDAARPDAKSDVASPPAKPGPEADKPTTAVTGS
jgi:spore germination cell wall hydrolase CwlJ-like protein